MLAWMSESNLDTRNLKVDSRFYDYSIQFADDFKMAVAITIARF